MTQKEIVTALRQCPRYGVDCAKGNCAFFKPNGAFEDCIKKKNNAAADLIENQQREIDALRQANEGLRYNLTEAQRWGEGTPPYEAGTDGPDGDEICRAALEAFGSEAQITMVFEEMAELQDVLCKFLRGRVDEDTRTHIAEEIADVEIMLCQMVMLFDCSGQVDKFRRYKLERLAGRIKEKKHGKENT